MDRILQAWRGAERLWVVFWIYTIGVGICLAIVGTSLTLLGNPYVLLPFLVAYWCYAAFLLVSQWRCAFNVDWRGWGLIIRGLVALSVLGFIGSLIKVVTT